MNKKENTKIKDKKLWVDIVEHLNDELQVFEKTEKCVVLSNNHRYRKKDFTLGLKIAKELMFNIETLSIIKERKTLQMLKSKCEKKQEQLNALTKKTDDGVFKLKQTSILTNPLNINSCRFVCGTTSHTKEFVMVFYKPLFLFPNSHSSLVQSYNKTSGQFLGNISGGFYVIKQGNDNIADTIELFGASSTYNGLYEKLYKDNIVEYGKKHNMNFKFTAV